MQLHQFGHPALFLLAGFVGMFVGWVGVLFGIVIPLSAAGKLAGTFDDRPSRSLLVCYARVVRRLASVERAALRRAD